MKRISLVLAILCLVFIVLCWPVQAQVSFFQPPTYTGSGNVFVADFNGDGKLDILTSDGTLNMGNGDGTFKLGTSLSGSAVGGAWPPEFPHISGSLDDVTLSQALDHVLKTFPGIWMYENCPRTDHKNRVVYFRFFFLRKLGSSVPFVE